MGSKTVLRQINTPSNYNRPNNYSRQGNNSTSYVSIIFINEMH